MRFLGRGGIIVGAVVVLSACSGEASGYQAVTCEQLSVLSESSTWPLVDLAMEEAERLSVGRVSQVEGHRASYDEVLRARYECSASPDQNLLQVVQQFETAAGAVPEINAEESVPPTAAVKSPPAAQQSATETSVTSEEGYTAVISPAVTWTVSIDKANSVPGKQEVVVSGQGSMTIRNTTPERNLPLMTTFRFEPSAFLAFPESALGGCHGELQGAGWAGAFLIKPGTCMLDIGGPIFVRDAPTPLAAGESVSMPLRGQDMASSTFEVRFTVPEALGDTPVSALQSAALGLSWLEAESEMSAQCPGPVHNGSVNVIYTSTGDGIC